MPKTIKALYKICVYIPESHLDVVKQAMFDAGAGHIGHYDACAWQVLGQGQFRPQIKSNPFIGKEGQIEHVAEYRVEMICPEAKLKTVISALKNSHPYEEPAYDVIQRVNI